MRIVQIALGAKEFIYLGTNGELLVSVYFWHCEFVVKCSYQAFMHRKYFLNHFEMHLRLPGSHENP